MKRKILTLHQLERFPIAGTQLIKQMTGVIRNTDQASPEVTVATLSDFFKFGGIMAMAVGDDEAGNRSVLLGIATLVLSVEINRTTARIKHIAVLPQYEGSGIDDELMRALTDAAEKAKITIK